MLQSMIGSAEFFSLVTALAVLAGRALKRLAPSLPPTSLPWVVAGFAFGVVFGDGLAAGLEWRAAGVAAGEGLMSGAVAIGAHELAKGVLVPIIGADGAELVLGKLKGKQ